MSPNMQGLNYLNVFLMKASLSLHGIGNLTDRPQCDFNINDKGGLREQLFCTIYKSARGQKLLHISGALYIIQNLSAPLVHIIALLHYHK